jgi:hypothetical protein
MPQSVTRYPRRGRAEGIAHRAKLRALLLPRLYPGCPLPRHATLAKVLGTCASTAGEHLIRMLAEAGIETEIRIGDRMTNGRWGAPRRRVVVAMPERRAAA